jgi:nucleotide-binding universal stress UspA family protein
MTIVVGIAPDGRGKAALQLGEMLARSSGDDLLLASIVPTPWPPSPAKVDAEYRAHLESLAAEALDQLGAAVAANVPAKTVVHHARSAPTGLLELAGQHDTSVIVVGSSSEGILGQVALGSVSSRLMHSSPIPVALPPRGYRCKPAERVSRVTAAYGAADDELVVAAAGVAAGVGASFRIASFAVRSRAPFTAGVGTEAERAMIDQWSRDIQAAARGALERVGHLAVAPHDLEAVVGYGEAWDEALEDADWQDGDVLVVGSSSIGPVARVFLGSRATKIVRHSPVPVVVVPRGAAAELADEAARAGLEPA